MAFFDWLASFFRPRLSIVRMPRDWFIERDGWKESNPKQNKAIAQEIWPLSKYCKKFPDITGADHAWCGSSRAAACKWAGYAYPERNESASAWIDHKEVFSTKVNWTTTGIIPMHATVVIYRKLSDGKMHYHVTGCDDDTSVVKGGKFPGRGGNQGNAINVAYYNQDDIVFVGLPKRAK